ncbi:MAG: hypothetical protein ACKOBY_02425 [Cyanobium sp.]
MRVTREALRQIRRRHFGYRITLVTQLLLLVLLPLAQRVPWLLSLLLCQLALVQVVFLSRFSLQRRSKPLIYGLGGLAIAMELLWHGALILVPSLGRLLTFPHVLVWLLFLLTGVFRKVLALICEPFVTVSVVLGAASGYFTLGIAGGVLFTALWVLQPSAFVAAALPPVVAAQPPTMAATPALMAAAFGVLTTQGSAQVAAACLTIAGQLYVVILIGLVLGRVRRNLL